MPNTALLTEAREKTLSLVGLIAAVVLAAGLLFAPERVWSNLLVGTYFLLTIALGGTLLVALTAVTGASWHVAFLRVFEALARVVPLAGIALLIVLACRMQHYGWHHHGSQGAGTFWFKELWLTPWFWLLRSCAYVVIWSLFSRLLVHRSRDHWSSADRTEAPTSVRGSAIFLAVYAVTFSLASADWIMALEPLWFSTMWGVYNFAGMVLATLAMVIILCVLLSMPGRSLQGVFRTEHLHDLGKLLIGFSCFWMYIWFCQYMLIWYSNLPEETSYFVTRTHGAWGPVVITSLLLNWLIPFFVLLPRPAKRSRSVMVKVAIMILIGRWVDLYVMVFPSTLGEPPLFGIWEAAAIVCLIALGLRIINHSFKRTRAVTQDNPFLRESLTYHAS